MPAADEPRTGPGAGPVPRTTAGVPRQRSEPGGSRGSDDAGTEPLDDAGTEPLDDAGRNADGSDAGTGPGGAGTVSGTPAAGPAATGLTEREQRVLDFERQWWKHAGAKEQSIRDTFGLSATRYYQLLNQLLDNPVALAVEPVLVARLRRLRAARSRARRG
ncbi:MULTISPECIES: DUF3263 domain-containing protein [unclassified Solwaraspora]|uniref:DUF3263 domain-containing protein n=1 Tax=unclassified Solwaraspora TaxID=2627926 RepID=UPI00248C8A77|nr:MULTISPECIES: DUF3263 domain-containing protein [unclassified Solwaraspora]WBB97508.1 DUF3263 domain-containing protein [Solwaraspora sp. WMMA2059]WBC18599.1 DUF3263 domain-containing protein [Solwaraspora sp. WMMA2080]WJK33992.1 DUF3263 domain-containing protein [Solwaraspora sp. WMMA2065]